MKTTIIEALPRIKAACQAHIARGGSVCRDSWGVARAAVRDDEDGTIIEYGAWLLDNNDSKACALGCLVIEESPVCDPDRYVDEELAAAQALGATREQVRAFTVGFDGHAVTASPHCVEWHDWYLAGRQLGVELLGEVAVVHEPTEFESVLAAEAVAA